RDRVRRICFAISERRALIPLLIVNEGRVRDPHAPRVHCSFGQDVGDYPPGWNKPVCASGGYDIKRLQLLLQTARARPSQCNADSQLCASFFEPLHSPVSEQSTNASRRRSSPGVSRLVCFCRNEGADG